jgi:shikimate 5-dehydrogenase
MPPYTPARQPTLYFFGVTTGKSSIMRVFPAWARHLGLQDAAVAGLDFVPHDRPERYREAVAFIKADPLSRGALITTHKLDLFRACRDLFDDLDEYAALMAETSCLSKRDGQLIAHAKDPVTSGLALDAFLPAHHWERTGAETPSSIPSGSISILNWAAFVRMRVSSCATRLICAVTTRMQPRWSA